MGQKIGNPIIWEFRKYEEYCVLTEDTSCSDGPINADMISNCKILGTLLGCGYVAGFKTWDEYVMPEDVEGYAIVCELQHDIYSQMFKKKRIINVYAPDDWRWFYQAEFDSPHQIFLKNEDDAVQVRLIL